jgi:hypothetical protein
MDFSDGEAAKNDAKMDYQESEDNHKTVNVDEKSKIDENLEVQDQNMEDQRKNGNFNFELSFYFIFVQKNPIKLNAMLMQRSMIKMSEKARLTSHLAKVTGHNQNTIKRR